MANVNIGYDDDGNDDDNGGDVDGNDDNNCRSDNDGCGNATGEMLW